VHASTDEETLAQINVDFPGWHIWRPRRSDGIPSSWAATRLEKRAGVDPTAIADTAEKLRDALTEQRELVERTGQRPLTAEAFPASDTP
jgi:hypothetical protein